MDFDVRLMEAEKRISSLNSEIEFLLRDNEQIQEQIKIEDLQAEAFRSEIADDCATRKRNLNERKMRELDAALADNERILKQQHEEAIEEMSREASRRLLIDLNRKRSAFEDCLLSELNRKKKAAIRRFEEEINGHLKEDERKHEEKLLLAMSEHKKRLDKLEMSE